MYVCNNINIQTSVGFHLNNVFCNHKSIDLSPYFIKLILHNLLFYIRIIFFEKCLIFILFLITKQ